MYPQGVCRIRKPAYAGNGCAIFQVFQTARLGKKIRYCPQTQLCGVALGKVVEVAGRGGVPPLAMTSL